MMGKEKSSIGFGLGLLAGVLGGIVAGILYAIVVGVKFVKAEDKSQRDEAKQKLITVIVGIVVTGVLIVLFYWLQGALLNGSLNFNNWFGF
jgi:prolipoprotein diacylglyceryltransferase